MEPVASGLGPTPGLSIIFPALNEAATIRDAIASVPLDDLQERGLRVEILVVDNNSADDTATIARQAQVTLVHEPRRGYGRALRTGFAHARGDIIVIADADGTYPLNSLGALIQPILDRVADVVTGSRLRGHITPGAMPPLHRYIGVPLLTFVLRMLFRIPISDGHCGMRALTHRALEGMRLETDGMEFASELLIRAAQSHLRIAEIPIDYGCRPPESISKLRSLRDGWRHLRLMLAEYRRNLTHARHRPEPVPAMPAAEASLTDR